MSAVLESLGQQYAAEVLKPDADEDLLKRLERGIRGLKGVTEPIGRCSVGVHFQKQFGLLFCIVCEKDQPLSLFCWLRGCCATLCIPSLPAS